jgi:hypothetical protein
MIHLDTNYLIGLLVRGSPQALHVDGWLAAGQSFAAAAVAWTEFVNGPVSSLEVSRTEAVLNHASCHSDARRRFWPPNSSIKLVAAAVPDSTA